MIRMISLSFISFLFYFNSLSAQNTGSAAAIAEVEAAEARMFQQVKYPTAAGYFKTDATDDFFSINADGTITNKEQSIADSARLKIFSMATYKFFDKKIRVYGDAAVVNGRCQAFMNNVYVVEFLYTVVFAKQNGKWMYASWQGTISKDSPPPPHMPKN
jgi:hypothetical protein